jgi:ABC transport system ATP-binding/permease protein
MADSSDWIFIGSASVCQIRVEGQGVASYHARCRLDAKGRVILEDLGSPAGTWLNGSRVARCDLSTGDTIVLGSKSVAAADAIGLLKASTLSSAPLSPPIPASPPPNESTPLLQTLQAAEGVTVIGRDPGAANKQRIVIDNPLVSRNHFGLLRTAQDEYYIWDLGSTYGTYLDSRRIGGRRERVLPQQVISIPGFRFHIGGQGSLAVASAKRGIGICALNLACDAGPVWKPRRLLGGVSIMVEPGTMLALMGPSGAGKTTLLRILAGQSRPQTGGQVLYDEVELYDHYDQIRSTLGYVPQEDILHPQLTVKEALFYSARLRLPADCSSREIRRRVGEMIDKLGIANQADVMIGSAEKRGISGGQRKRVNLAMELLPDPAVLLLDEPTSGLSSADAEKVVRSLRALADEGRTILVTIHQPATHIYEMFDQMAFVDNDTVRRSPAPPPQPGRLIFFGPARDAPGYFQRLDPSGGSRNLSGADAIFASVDRNPTRDTATCESLYQASPYYRPASAAPSGQSAQASRPKNLPSAWRQLGTLMARLWSIKVADPWAAVQMFLLQPLIVGAGIALASGKLHTEPSYSGPEYVKDFMRVGKTLFFVIFTVMWFGCSNTAREIVGEIAVYRRERTAGLSLAAYMASKLFFFSGVTAAQSLIVTLVCYFACGLKGGLLPLYAVFWLASVCGLSVGLLISSLAPVGEKAIQMVPLAMLPMILFGGGVTRLVDLQSDFARTVSAVIPARWAFEGALAIENAGRPVAVPPMPGKTAVAAAYTIVHHYFEESPHDDSRLWLCLAELVLFAAALASLAAFSLWRQDLH